MIEVYRIIKTIPVLAVLLALAGCSGNDFSDIDQFIADTRSQPRGVIDPIPVFKPYKAFRYNAASKRAPFDIPVQVRQVANLYKASDVKPDPKRVPEQLESFNLESLAMVGTLEQSGQRWALIDDGSGKRGNKWGKGND